MTSTSNPPPKKGGAGAQAPTNRAGVVVNNVTVTSAFPEPCQGFSVNWDYVNIGNAAAAVPTLQNPPGPPTLQISGINNTNNDAREFFQSVPWKNKISSPGKESESVNITSDYGGNPAAPGLDPGSNTCIFDGQYVAQFIGVNSLVPGGTDTNILVQATPSDPHGMCNAPNCP